MLKKSRQSGLTLIEAMIAIAIIGVLSGIAIPNIVAAYPSWRLSSAADDLFRLMQRARMRAIKEKRQVIIAFELQKSGSGYDGRVVFDAEGKREIVPAAGSIAAHYGGGVHFGFGSARKGASLTGKLPQKPLSFQRDRIVFNEVGLNTAGYIYLANAQHEAYAVGANSTGVIMYKRWTGKQWK